MKRLDGSISNRRCLKFFYKICQAAKGNIIDVGANTGFYTVLATAALSTNKKIWAFEPDPHIFPILTANITLNGIGDSVVLKNEGRIQT